MHKQFLTTIGTTEITKVFDDSSEKRQRNSNQHRRERISLHILTVLNGQYRTETKAII